MEVAHPSVTIDYGEVFLRSADFMVSGSGGCMLILMLQLQTQEKRDDGDECFCCETWSKREHRTDLPYDAIERSGRFDA